MSLNVQQLNVTAGHTLFIDSWIQVMPNQPVISGIMPRSVGVMRLLRQLMVPRTLQLRVQHSKVQRPIMHQSQLSFGK